jgi:hypothetical protein
MQSIEFDNGIGADPNCGSDWLPIHAAAYGESLVLTKLLLQYGANINAKYFKLISSLFISLGTSL